MYVSWPIFSFHEEQEHKYLQLYFQKGEKFSHTFYIYALSDTLIYCIISSYISFESNPRFDIKPQIICSKM